MNWNARMKWYAETPRALARQLLTDGFVVTWVAGWSWLAWSLHRMLARLAEPGAQVQASAGDLARQLDGAVVDARDLPFAGDFLGAPLSAAAEAARGVAAAGATGRAVATSLAWWVPLLLAAGPVVTVLLWWLPRRLREAREAGAAQRLGVLDLELFAWRALAHRPLRDVARVAPDPAAALRRGDPRVVAALAELELAALGVRPPRPGGPEATAPGRRTVPS